MLLQQLLTQDHKKPLEELVELACIFEAVEHKSLKRVDLDKKEDNVAATKQVVSEKRLNDLRVVRIISHLAVLAVEENIPRAVVNFAMLNGKNAVKWGI